MGEQGHQGDQAEQDRRGATVDSDHERPVSTPRWRRPHGTSTHLPALDEPDDDLRGGHVQSGAEQRLRGERLW